MSRVGTAISTLSAIALLASVSAGGAAAETGAKWLIFTSGGVEKRADELPAVLNGKLEGSEEVLLTEILKIEVEKTCTAVEITGMKLEGEGGISPGKLKFTGCKVLLNKKENKECVPHSPGAPPGTIETNKLRGDLGLHTLKDKFGEYIRNAKGEIILHAPIRMEPETGSVFMTMEMGSLCPIGTKVPIGGILYGKDSEIEKIFLSNPLIEHLFIEGPGSNVWVISETAEHKVTLDGGMLLFLSSTHSGLKWAGSLSGTPIHK